MAIISREHNLLFIMTPRTACTAIGELLCQEYGGQFVPSEDIIDSRGFISVQRKHSTLAELIQHKILPEDELRSLLKLVAVRNPYDSLVSLYLKKREKYRPLLRDRSSWVYRVPHYADDMRYCQTHTFNEWIRKVCHRKLVRRLLGQHPSMFAEHVHGTDIVLRYETIEDDLKQAFRTAMIPWKATIPRTNLTHERSDRDYRGYYSKFGALAVKLAYSHDLKTYDYRF